LRQVDPVGLLVRLGRAVPQNLSGREHPRVRAVRVVLESAVLVVGTVVGVQDRLAL